MMMKKRVFVKELKEVDASPMPRFPPKQSKFLNSPGSPKPSIFSKPPASKKSLKDVMKKPIAISLGLLGSSLIAKKIYNKSKSVKKTETPKPVKKIETPKPVKKIETPKSKPVKKIRKNIYI